MLIFTVIIYGSHNLITYLINNRRNAKNTLDIENDAPFILTN